MNEELCYTSAVELSERIRRGSLSPLDVVEACLDRIDTHDDDVNAFRVIFDERARERARQAEAAVDAGEVFGPLHGVPVAVKDNIDVAGESTTSGRKFLLDRPVERDSVVVRRLRDAGAIILGKTHMAELGYGTGDSTWAGATSTPFDLTRNSGGSSSGSAAAVASGFVPLAVGTDGGGSVRIPASFCGVYGIKPTFRRVARLNRRPDDAFASLTPFSEFGPLARSVEDAALLLSVMAGPHGRDPFADPLNGTDYVGAVQRRIEGLTVAYSPNLDGFPVDDRVRWVIEDAVDVFERMGVTVEEADIGIEHSHDALTDTWMSWVDVSRAVGAERLKTSGIDLDGDHRDDVHPEFVSAIERGRDVTAVEHGLTTGIRTDVLNAVEDCFREYDLIVSPTLAVPPIPNASDGYTVGPSEVAGEAVDPHLGWCLTHPFNFTGHPAASVPAGFTDDDLPIGLQIVGPRHAEETVLAASAAFERSNPWHDAYRSLL